MAAASADIEASAETTPLMSKPDDKGGFFHFVMGYTSFLPNLKKVFGYELLVLIAITQHLQKGFALSLVDQAVPYIFKSYRVDAASVQLYSTIRRIPWALKPIIGLLSDGVPIFGLSKAPYLVVTAVLGSAACFSVANGQLGLGLFVLCLFVYNAFVATSDLLSEAVTVVRIKEHPTIGPGLVSFAWGGILLSMFIAVVASGPLLQHFQPTNLFFVGALCSLAVLIPVVLGFVGEKRHSAIEQEIFLSGLWQHTELLTVSVVITVSAIALIICPFVCTSRFMTCVTSLGVGLVVLVSCSIVFTPVVAKVVAFAVVTRTLNFQISGATFYFYTDTKAQYLEGPHFSPFFYNTVILGASAFAQALGVVFYNRYMSEWKYRDVIVCVSIIMFVLDLVPTIMFTRQNVALGIPDEYFVLGCSLLESMASSFDLLPITVMLSHMCPEGVEATMYAILAGIFNLSYLIANYCGSYLLEIFGVLPTGADAESAQFQNLWKVSLIHAATLLLPLCALNLLPSARQSEALLQVDDMGAGSLWRHWRSRS